MRSEYCGHRRQKGAVAIIAGLSMVVLIGFLGLVLDLGRLYVNKSELQNAADASALSGARELNGTASGVDTAVTQAIATAALNFSDFGNNSVAITDANIQLSSTPHGPWVDHAAAVASPSDKYFIKVDTTGIAQGTIATWVMQVLGPTSTSTFGLAVAGRSVCETIPAFVCALAGSGPPDYGYVKGQSYLFHDCSGGSCSPIGPGNVGWLDPVPPSAPKLISGTNDLRDVICRGKIPCINIGTFTSLTQPAWGPMANALNTRFGEYNPPAPLNDPEACRPDKNVKEYPPSVAKHWMATGAGNQPTTQSEQDPGGGVGVHWSGYRPDPIPGTPATDPAVYPATGSPYSQTSGTLFFSDPPSYKGQPTVGLAVPERRILTMGLADNCGTITGSNKPVHLVAFAKFLLQVKVVGTGSNKGLWGEFLKTVPSASSSIPDIVLYQ